MGHERLDGSLRAWAIFAASPERWAAWKALKAALPSTTSTAGSKARIGEISVPMIGAQITTLGRELLVMSLPNLEDEPASYAFSTFVTAVTTLSSDSTLISSPSSGDR